MTQLAINQVARAAIESIERGSEFEDNTILSLYHVFQHTLLAALDLLDRNKVLRAVHQRREHFQVYGAEEVHTIYTDLPDMCSDTAADWDDRGPGWSIPSGWCSCPTFAAAVVIAMDQPMCKHLLAVVLYLKLDKPLTVRNNQEIDSTFLDDD
ncbi:hypothetical protein FRC12_011459 [Ceratobasidium sp. 428]|nr:hypothetical protein FRC12_011459 [Ceratobasidium sp. 428]